MLDRTACIYRCSRRGYTAQREEAEKSYWPGAIYTRLGRRINKDFPSRASLAFESGNISNILRDPSSILIHSLLLSIIALPGLHIHLLFLPGPPSYSRARLYMYIRAFIISARETFFIDCPGTDLSDTGCKLFLPFVLHETLLFIRSSPDLFRIYCSRPFFTHFLRRFPRHVARAWIRKPRFGFMKSERHGRKILWASEVGNVSPCIRAT